MAHLLDGQLSADARQALLKYIETPDAQRAKELAGKPAIFSLDSRMLDQKVRGLIHLIMSTPEYQLC